jgi:hypothetical protein
VQEARRERDRAILAAAWHHAYVGQWLYLRIVLSGRDAASSAGMP